MLKELANLEKCLVQMKAPVIDYLRPGLNRNSIGKYFDAFHICPTNDLIDLYHWHDGVDFYDMPTGRISFTNWGVFYPLKDSITVYKRYENSEFISRSLFPIFLDDNVWIDLNDQSTTFGQLYFFSPSLLILTPVSCYDSLKDLIKTSLFCFENGLYAFDEDGFLMIEDDSVKDISKKMNPNSEYWKIF